MEKEINEENKQNDIETKQAEDSDNKSIFKSLLFALFAGLSFGLANTINGILSSHSRFWMVE